MAQLCKFYRFQEVALDMITVQSGLLPTSGFFFSKCCLNRGGIKASQWAFVGALLFSRLINAIVFFRLIEIACLHGSKAHWKENTDKDHGHYFHGDADPDAAPSEALEILNLTLRG